MAPRALSSALGAKPAAEAGQGSRFASDGWSYQTRIGAKHLSGYCIGRVSGMYGATPRPWAPTAGKVVGSGRGATSPRSHSEPNIDVASDGSRRAVRFDEPGHRLVRRRREAARGVGYVGRPGELT